MTSVLSGPQYDWLLTLAKAISARKKDTLDHLTSGWRMSGEDLGSRFTATGRTEQTRHGMEENVLAVQWRNLDCPSAGRPARARPAHTRLGLRNMRRARIGDV